MINRLLRSNFVKFSKSVANLMLITDGDESWLEVKLLRKSWHYLLLTVISYSFIAYIVTNLFSPYMENNITLLFMSRLFGLVLLSIALVLFLILIYAHYKYLLSTGKDLRFKNIISFYVVVVIIFGKIYFQLYVLEPNFFVNSITYYKPSPIFSALGLNSYSASLEFMLYASTTSFSLEYPRIHSNSAIVSLINVLQVITNFIIISILVATFVQKSTESAQKDDNNKN